MNALKKFFTAIFLSFLIFNLSNVTFAEPQEISAEGEYRLGDRDSRETAKTAALADAKRKIAEQVGVYVRSYSESNNFKITNDQIKVATNALVKIKTESVEFFENGTLCKAYITAVVDTDNIANIIKGSYEISSPVQLSDEVSKILKMGGFHEYNGHYYKVFNDKMTWQQAREHCKNIGGYLVVLTSSGENETVCNLIRLILDWFYQNVAK